MSKIFESFKDVYESNNDLHIACYISSGREDVIEANANEFGVKIDWDILNKEIQEYENTVFSYLRKSKGYNNVLDEGYDGSEGSEDRVITFYITDKKLSERWEKLIYSDERFSFTDSRYSADKKLFDIINKLLIKSKFLELCTLGMDVLKL